MRKVLIGALVALAVLAISVPTVLFIASLNDESTSSNEEKLEISFDVDKYDAEDKRVYALKKECSEYCDGKEWYTFEGTFKGYDNIISKTGELVYGFEKYVDDSKEGGNVAVSMIYVDTDKNEIFKVKNRSGAGKTLSISGVKLEPQSWDLTIEAIVDTFIKEYTDEKLSKLEKPELCVNMRKDKAEVNLSYSIEGKTEYENFSFSLVD